ncbi:MAG: UDP-N-acetylmuramate dehydrogenase [Clostridia bacterium]|nr:UDP-N-acetylmuramate dehydrogenase [Clostridia bacterium]
MKVEYNKIKEYIDESKVRFNEPMEKHTTLKVGGPADILVLPENVQDVIDAMEFAKEYDVPVTVIGNGSKLLVLDGGIRGLVIKLGSKFSNVEVNGEYITAEIGLSMPRLAIIAKDNELTGLEFAAGIPGYLGGGVFMNAGAYGGELGNVIEEVTYLDKNNEVKTLTHDELEFGYRSSYFKNHKDEGNIILQAKFKLTKGNKEEIEAKMKENNDSRKAKQPLEYPNAGSTFKRPEGYFVGKLIDDLGLKGYRIGGAEVSTKHSGFIVNVDHAKAKDVLDLINYIKEKVFEANKVKLEEEIIILGEEV